MYVIRKGNKYLKAKEGGWVGQPMDSIGTSSKEVAEYWAKKHGGKVEDFDIFGD